MIETLLGIESALLVVMARCRKRAAVLRSLAAKRPDSAGIRALTRSLANRTRSTTNMERMLAKKFAQLIRDFVHTGAFDQLILSAIAYIRARWHRNRGIR
jgi:hypothetical protein